MIMSMNCLFPRSVAPVLALALAVPVLAPRLLLAEGSVVEIRREEGRLELLRNGERFWIRGAGGTRHLEDLVRYGGNSIRTWGIGSLEEEIDGKPLLDYCHEKGIAVTAGIWIGHERHGFDYGDPEQVERQRDEVRAAVRKYRDHPALLMWGLGNEMEGPTSATGDARIWQELNRLAAIVKAEDPAHPVMTVIAGAPRAKIEGILAHYPNIDVLGVNAYGGASGAVRAAKEAGWTKGFVLTEFGPVGHWEVASTPWGAPIEPSSFKKAAGYYATIELLEEEDDICLGSYAFLWGQKQEVTSTWYGMFLESGEKLPSVDAASYAWTGKWPANRSPRIAGIESTLREAVVAPGGEAVVKVEASDPEGDELQWHWAVVEESRDRKVGGDRESAPPEVKGAVQGGAGEATVRVPTKEGAYRLFVTVRDGQGGASADNFPFRVAR